MLGLIISVNIAQDTVYNSNQNESDWLRLSSHNLKERAK